MCINSTTTNSTRVPLGDNENENIEGEKQHRLQRRLRSGQLCCGGGEYVNNSATKTPQHQSSASQVSGESVLTDINRNATTNDTEERLSDRTNSGGDRKCSKKPFSPLVGTNPGGTKQPCHQKNATMFYNHWTEEFGKHLRAKRKIHVGVPEIGATVLVVDTLQPPHNWYLTEVTGVKHRNNDRKDPYAHGKTNYVPQTFEKMSPLAKNNQKPP